MGAEERRKVHGQVRGGEERRVGEERSTGKRRVKEATKKWLLTMKVLEIPAGFPLSSLCVMMGEANEY